MKISQMVQAIKNGTLTSRELVLKYISKIEENKHLNAVIEINPQAVEIAESLDSAEEKHGILYGVPILVKDNINTGDAMRTSAGSVALAENIAPADAPIVCKLREAGAVILGKANMTEFANYMTDGAMPNGYSSRGGQTLNFHDEKADPGGSSSGSGVAIAADLCAAAIGTETAGSIISPSQASGITGIKPTAGLLSSEGIIPISFTFDTAGPMTRYAEDAKILLNAMGGRTYKSYDKNLSGVRIGICSMVTDKIEKQTLSANKHLVQTLRNLGAECVDLPEHNLDIEKLFYPIAKNEFKFGIKSYLQSMNNPKIPQSLSEIIKYNEKNPGIALKYGQDNLVDIESTTSGEMTEPAYREALLEREKAVKILDEFFDSQKINVMFMPTADSDLGALAGFPCMTVPIGKTSEGLPIGSYFLAKRFDEDVLLRVAEALETVKFD